MAGKAFANIQQFLTSDNFTCCQYSKPTTSMVLYEGWQSSLQQTSLQEDTPPGGHASRRTRLQGGHFSRRTFLQLVNLTGASCRTSLQLKASRRTALQLSASRRTCLQADRPPGRQASRRTRLQLKNVHNYNIYIFIYNIFVSDLP